MNRIENPQFVKDFEIEQNCQISIFSDPDFCSGSILVMSIRWVIGEERVHFTMKSHIRLEFLDVTQLRYFLSLLVAEMKHLIERG